MDDLIRRCNMATLGVVVLILVSMALAGCRDREEVFTIGIISSISIHAKVIDGFKAGMTGLGYEEGRDIRYIYHGIIENTVQAVDGEINRLLSTDTDLLLPVGNDAALRAKEAVYGTGMPVLFSACSEVIEAGLVEDMAIPGDSITGVTTAESTPKALEWLVTVIPGAKKVFLPYNPDDEVSINSLVNLDEAAERMGIEIVLCSVGSVEEAVSAIEGLPEDIDAVFRVPSPTLDPGNAEISRAAIKRRLPMGARVNLDGDVLVTFATDHFYMGQQTARLAHQIRLGVHPGDLPVEMSDPVLTINLRAAGEIGLEIPDSVLTQAKNIIR